MGHGINKTWADAPVHNHNHTYHGASCAVEWGVGVADQLVSNQGQLAQTIGADSLMAQQQLAQRAENHYTDALKYGNSFMRISSKPTCSTYYEQLKAEIRDWLK